MQRTRFSTKQLGNGTGTCKCVFKKQSKELFSFTSTKDKRNFIMLVKNVSAFKTKAFTLTARCSHLKKPTFHLNLPSLYIKYIAYL